MATISGPDGELRAMVPTGSALREGETVDVRFDPVDLYPFSPDTGELLSKPDPDGSESLSKPKPE